LLICLAARLFWFRLQLCIAGEPQRSEPEHLFALRTRALFIVGRSDLAIGQLLLFPLKTEFGFFLRGHKNFLAIWWSGSLPLATWRSHVFSEVSGPPLNVAAPANPELDPWPDIDPPLSPFAGGRSFDW
jgi:hypothetical protein